MIIIVEFISISALYLLPWAICECEHRRKRRKLTREIEAQQSIIHEQKRQIETLKARESRQQLVIGAQRAKLEGMLAKLKISEKALPPASAKSNGAAIVRVTTQLTANSAGPR